MQENLSRRVAESRARGSDRQRGGRRSSCAWQRSRGAVPTVVALRQRFEAIRRAELQRLEGKLGALSPEARARVDEVTRLIVEKLLLEPTEQLKALPDEETQVAYTEARQPAVPAARRDGRADGPRRSTSEPPIGQRWS